MKLAIQEGITNPCIFVQWVNRFRAAGPEALRLHKKGRKKTLNKPKIDDKPQTMVKRTVDTSAEHVKEYLELIFTEMMKHQGKEDTSYIYDLLPWSKPVQKACKLPSAKS